MRGLLFLISVFCFYNYYGQNVIIRGNIRNEKNKAIFGAMVSVPSQFEFTRTDSSGHYSFTCSKEDTIVVMIDGEGYNKVSQNFDMKGKKDSLLKFDYVFNVFEKIQSPFEEVTIVAWKESPKINAISLRNLDIKTNPGANADIISAMKTLPGVNQATSQNGIFIGGGSGEESKIFIDGLLVNNFFYNGTPDISQRGRFPPDFFKKSTLIQTVYPADYGQALSSVVLLETSELPRASSLDINSSTIGLNVAHNRLYNNNSVFGATISYVNPGAYFNIVHPKYDFEKFPQFIDGSVSYKKKLSRGMFKLFSSNGYSSLSLFRPNIDDNSINEYYANKNLNSFNSLVYSSDLKNNFKILSAAGYSYNYNDVINRLAKSDKSFFSGKLNYITKDQTFQFRTTIKHSGRKLEYSVGTFLLFNNINTDSLLVAKKENFITNNNLSVYGNACYVFTSKIQMEAGLRLEYNYPFKKLIFSPRSALIYKIASTKKLYASAGLLNQEPSLSYLRLNKELNSAYSNNYGICYEYDVPHFLFRTTAYYKKYSNLVTINDNNNLANEGYGHSAGLDLFTNGKIIKYNLDYTASYSLIDSKRKYLNYPNAVTPSFVPQNIFYLALKRYFAPISIYTGISYTFQTGLPYNDPLSAKFMNEKTIPYNNVNLTLVHIRNIKKTYCLFVFSVNNLLNNNQVFGYNYSVKNPTRRLELSPLTSRFVFMGIFLNIGINRTEETIQKML